MAKVAIASPKSVIWRPNPAARRTNLNISISLCVCLTTQKDRAPALEDGDPIPPSLFGAFRFGDHDRGCNPARITRLLRPLLGSRPERRRAPGYANRMPDAPTQGRGAGGLFCCRIKRLPGIATKADWKSSGRNIWITRALPEARRSEPGIGEVLHSGKSFRRKITGVRFALSAVARSAWRSKRVFVM